MCPKVTHQYKKNIKNKIIKSAISTFSKYGYDKSRMDDIVKTVKLVKELYIFISKIKKNFLMLFQRGIQMN